MKCFRFPFYLTTQEQSPDLDSLNNVLHFRLLMPLPICLFFFDTKQFSFSSYEIFPATDHHCPPFPASLLIPNVKLLNKIQIAFYYLLTEYYWSLRSEELLLQQKNLGQIGGISNDIFITLKISNIDGITLSQSSILMRSKSYPGSSFREIKLLHVA